MVDLESAYNRQLSKVCSMVEELIRVDQNAIIILTKVLLHFEHYVCTVYGLSKQSYSSVNEIYAGTG